MTQVGNHEWKRLKVGPRGGGYHIYIYISVYMCVYIYIYMYRGFFDQGMGFQFFGLGACGVWGD